MNPIEQRIAIAEACGWTGCILYNVESGKEPRGHPPKQQSCYQGYTEPIPNYPSDLNAMHEAEKMLDVDKWQRRDYIDYLNNNGDQWAHTHATAAQRAEAFLKALNIWKD